MSSEPLATVPKQTSRYYPILAALSILYLLIAAFGLGYRVPGGMASLLMLHLGMIIGMPLQFILVFIFLYQLLKYPSRRRLLLTAAYALALPMLWCGGAWQVVLAGRNLVEAEISMEQLAEECQLLTKANAGILVGQDSPSRRVIASEDQPATIRRLRPLVVTAGPDGVTIALGTGMTYDTFYQFVRDQESGKWVLNRCAEVGSERLVSIDE